MKAPKKVYLSMENRSTGGIWFIVTPSKKGAYKYEYVLAGSERRAVARWTKNYKGHFERELIDDLLKKLRGMK